MDHSRFTTSLYIHISPYQQSIARSASTIKLTWRDIRSLHSMQRMRAMQYEGHRSPSSQEDHETERTEVHRILLLCSPILSRTVHIFRVQFPATLSKLRWKLRKIDKTRLFEWWNLLYWRSSEGYMNWSLQWMIPRDQRSYLYSSLSHCPLMMLRDARLQTRRHDEPEESEWYFVFSK